MRLSFWAALSSSLVVISAVLVILLSANSLVRDRLESDVSSRLQTRLDQEIALFRKSLDGVNATLSAITKGPLVHGWLEAEPGSSQRETLRQQVNAQLKSVVKSHPHYFQLRFLDANGHEQARVDRRGEHIAVLSEAELQDKSGRDYFQPILALPEDETYVSPLNLNREHGAIERPLRPTLRIATPVFDQSGIRRGAMIVNLDAEALLPPRDLGDAHFLMVDDKGAFLRHPDRSREFGLELGSGMTLGRDYSEAAEKLGQRVAGTERLSRGLMSDEAELIAFRQLTGDASDSSQEWLMIFAQSEALAFAPIQSLSRTLMAIVFWVTILACVIGWLLAYRVTRPLTQITNIARRITSGDLQSGTEVQGQGEVAELSAAFNLMTSRLRRMIEQERQTGQELSRLNCELEQSNLELRRSNQDLADFAHAASHDLKTPLRALRALPEWIQDDLDGVDLPQNVQGHLQNLQAQGERMDNVITGLLEYSRVGKAENQAQTFDPRATAIRVLQLLAIPDRFTVDLIVEPQKITGVQPEFEIVLRNLVQNAVAHHDREHGRIGIRCSDSDQTLVLEVSDDGPGIPPEFHERVLLPFQSLKRRDKGGGSGLGLALVNKIVQRSGGKLKIVSEAGTRGTLFRATLPIKSSALDVMSTSAQAA